VRLVPSTTAFLPRCAATALHLSVGPDAVVSLHYAATRPCHLPPLHLRAVLRAAGGAIVYRGPALEYEQLSGNYARDGEEHAPLVGCTARVATAAVSGSGLSAAGAVRC